MHDLFPQTYGAGGTSVGSLDTFSKHMAQEDGKPIETRSSIELGRAEGHWERW